MIVIEKKRRQKRNENLHFRAAMKVLRGNSNLVKASAGIAHQLRTAGSSLGLKDITDAVSIAQEVARRSRAKNLRRAGFKPN
jgi:hypothetical protein